MRCIGEKQEHCLYRIIRDCASDKLFFDQNSECRPYSYILEVFRKNSMYSRSVPYSLEIAWRPVCWNL